MFYLAPWRIRIWDLLGGSQVLYPLRLIKENVSCPQYLVWKSCASITACSLKGYD
ncbi:hypothetical protein SK128_004950 [Halocaridina rubra]|uniref:Uncharacterized protein n=1 Tax=Halocaridina rubra TaxID=373956 RepID=A0AAN8WMQ9_HALRR